MIPILTVTEVINESMMLSEFYKKWIT